MDDRRLNEIRERAQSVYRLTEWEGIAAIDKVELAQLQKDIPDLLDHIDDLKFRQEQDAATIWALMDVLPGREEMSEAQWEAWRQALRSEAVQEIQAVYGERDRLTVAYHEYKTKYELERAIYRKENEDFRAEVERLQGENAEAWELLKAERFYTRRLVESILPDGYEKAEGELWSKVVLDAVHEARKLRHAAVKESLTTEPPVELPPPAVHIIARCIPITGDYHADGSRVERIEVREGESVRLEHGEAGLRIERGEPSGNSGELPPGYMLDRKTVYFHGWILNGFDSHNVWLWKCEDDSGIGRDKEDAIAAAWDHYRANGGGR
jgi:hypothetical protein